MRSKNALRNLIVSLIYEVFILALGLIVPRFIILSYGDSINGLTQTINRLLTLVNLLQAGAVGASIFQMLRPVAQNDYETQSAVMYASKKFFDRMGVIYLAIIAVCAVFFGFYLQDEVLAPVEIMLSFLVLAINGSLYFFFTSRYDIVFSSYQKKYLLTLASFVERIVYYVLLFLVIHGELYFVFMYVALLCGGLVRVGINTIFYHKLVGDKIVKRPANKEYKIKDRRFLMLSSIGDQTIAAAPTVIITTFINLAASSVFSVYSMIYLSMKTLINSFHHAVSAIFGNLVATGSDRKISEVFDALLYVFSMLGALLAACCAFLFMPFIDLYAKGFTEGAYIQPALACFIVAYVAVFSVKTVINFVSHSCGLFRDTCKATLACGAVSLVVCVLAALFLDMPYVMLGVLLYELSSMCVLIAAFKKKISWFKLNIRWISRAVVMIVLPTLSWWVYKSGIFFIGGWFGWFFMAVVYAVLMALLLLIYTLIFDRKVIFLLFGYVKTIFSRSKNKIKAQG